VKERESLYILKFEGFVDSCNIFIGHMYLFVLNKKILYDSLLFVVYRRVKIKKYLSFEDSNLNFIALCSVRKLDALN